MKKTQCLSPSERRSRMVRLLGLAVLYFFYIVQTHAEPLEIVQAPVTLIDTGLDMPFYGPAERVGVWVDEHRIAINASLRSGVGVEKRFGSVMLYDLRTGKSKEVISHSFVRSWDASTGRVYVSYRKDDARAVGVVLKVDEAGEVLSRILAANEMQEQPDYPADRHILGLRIEHGYVDRGAVGKGGQEQAVLHRPDGVTRELDITGRRFESNKFISNLNKYVIRTSSCYSQGDKCPPDIWLMSPEGDIETISLPKRILTAIPMVSNAHAVKDGVLLTVRHPKVEGIFLWRNEALYELWRVRLPSLWNLNTQEFWGGEVISPDGCKVAFFKAWDSKATTARNVFIFNHCGIGR